MSAGVLLPFIYTRYVVSWDNAINHSNIVLSKEEREEEDEEKEEEDEKRGKGRRAVPYSSLIGSRVIGMNC